MPRLARAAGALAALVAPLALAPAARAQASAAPASYDFFGTFARDNDVRLFQFVLGAGRFTVETLSYGGGTTASGATVARGGFDTRLLLYDANGDYLDYFDDSGPNQQYDPTTDQAYDAGFNEGFFFNPLLPGTYYVALVQYDNFNGGNLFADGFSYDGQPFFTNDPTFTSNNPGVCPSGAFRDVSDVTSYPQAYCRTGNFALTFTGDAILSARDLSASALPEPATALLVAPALAGAALLRRRRRA